jgi:hypothetical protein
MIDSIIILGKISPENCKRNKNPNIVFTSSELIPDFSNSFNQLKGVLRAEKEWL